MGVWYSINPLSGENDYNITITVEENTDSAETRTGIICAYNREYNLVDYCTIEQQPREIETIIVSPSSYTGNYQASSITTTITSTGNWTASTSDIGITLNVYSGESGNSTVIITFSENPKLEYNERVISFSTIDRTAEFIIRQSARIPDSNQIFYKTDTNEMLDKYADLSEWTSALTETWGARLISHTYTYYGIYTFNNVLTKIPDDVFSYFDSTKEVRPTIFVLPSSITYIGNASFKCDTYLQKINLDNITYIGNEAFYQCSLTSEPSWCSGLTNIGNSAFYEAFSGDIDLFETQLTYIGNRAFWNVYPDTVYLPQTQTYIGDYAFSNFNRGNLSDLYIDCMNVITISNFAFYQSAPVSSGQGQGTYYIHNGSNVGTEWLNPLRNGGFNYRMYF